MSYRLGIDLGTTYTAAAVNRDGRVEMASLGGRSDAIASVLLVRDDDSTLVGDAAEYRGASEPERLAREFKRRIGDTTPILLGGRPYSAESLTARLLRWVIAEVTKREGGPPETIGGNTWVLLFPGSAHPQVLGLGVSVSTRVTAWARACPGSFAGCAQSSATSVWKLARS